MIHLSTVNKGSFFEFVKDSWWLIPCKHFRFWMERMLLDFVPSPVSEIYKQVCLSKQGDTVHSCALLLSISLADGAAIFMWTVKMSTNTTRGPVSLATKERWSLGDQRNIVKTRCPLNICSLHTNEKTIGWGYIYIYMYVLPIDIQICLLLTTED